jgi:hypothetical protein
MAPGRLGRTGTIVEVQILVTIELMILVFNHWMWSLVGAVVIIRNPKAEWSTPQWVGGAVVLNIVVFGFLL